MVVTNITVILVLVIVPVLLILLSWVIYELLYHHILERRLILGGKI